LAPDYARINTLTGWAVFAASLSVYLLTMSPTASFWDCGEFIACANELEVTHPPGAPLFLLLGRLFAMLAPAPTSVAFMVNLISAFAGAFTALFTCWIVTMLAKKALASQAEEAGGDAQPEKEKTLTIMLAGVVAGLCCTFADSVWFNAVEAEVYAMSGCCTALVVWLMLKWEARADEPDHLRWIVLIAYVMGLSIGVHLLNLLTIPALAVLYYFRKFPFTGKGLAAAFGIGVAILGAVQYGIIQYSFVAAWQMEKLFTGAITRAGADAGGMGLPMGTGSLVLALAVLGLVIAALVVSYRRKNVILHTVALCYTVIVLGFSSYAVIFIRSKVDASIDMNNPENILTFLSYMRREQYGDRPLVRGTLYNAQPQFDEVTGRAILASDGMNYMMLNGEEKYVEDAEKQDYTYASEDKVLFPRMYEPGKYNAGPYGYRNYVRLKGRSADDPADDRPSRAEDAKFFWEYQTVHMYWRYFLWNFVGRRSDVQDANWEGTGFATKATDPGVVHNKGNNHFFYLPLLFGLFGLIWHFTVQKRDASFVGLLFFFTGMAIIIYLNQTPEQPRERDYSYAGSFQTFCIWIGMGVMFFAELLRKYLGKGTPYAAGAICLLAPILMAADGWDDHTRKGRWIDIEFAKNLLNSCDEDAILFTGGDNDTFPLWYVQEVEGFRTDVRVVNLELLISDWYINLMRKPHNKAKGIPVTLDPRKYAGEESIVIQPYKAHPIVLPALGTDSAMVWQPRTRGYILRKDSVMINMLQNIAADGWKRPVYFANLMGNSSYLNLNDYFVVEGLAYRVLPRKRTATDIADPYNGRLDVEKMSNQLMHTFLYTGLNDPSVNHDEHIRNAIAGNYRTSFFRLCAGLADRIDSLRQDSLTSQAARPEIAQHQARIRALARFARTHITYEAVPPRMQQVLMMADALIRAGVDDEAETELNTIAGMAFDELDYYSANKVEINPKEVAFQALVLKVQFLWERDRKDEAKPLAARLDTYVGEGVVSQLLR